MKNKTNIHKQGFFVLVLVMLGLATQASAHCFRAFVSDQGPIDDRRGYHGLDESDDVPSRSLGRQPGLGTDIPDVSDLRGFLGRRADEQRREGRSDEWR